MVAASYLEQPCCKNHSNVPDSGDDGGLGGLIVSKLSADSLACSGFDSLEKSNRSMLSVFCCGRVVVDDELIPFAGGGDGIGVGIGLVLYDSGCHSGTCSPR